MRDCRDTWELRMYKIRAATPQSCTQYKAMPQLLSKAAACALCFGHLRAIALGPAKPKANPKV